MKMKVEIPSETKMAVEIPSPRRKALSLDTAIGALHVVILLLLMVGFLFPVFYMALTSIKPEVLIKSASPVWFFAPTLDNYRTVFVDQGALRYVINSIVIGVLTTVIAFVLGIPAAYSLARFTMRAQKNVEFWIISTRMMPPIAMVLPFYMMIVRTPLFGTYWGLVAIYLLMDAPFVVWMMKGFFEQVPADIDEAALVDGCNRLSALLRVVLPLTSGGLVVTAFFCVIFSWNEFLYAFLILQPGTWTVPVAMANVRQSLMLPWGQATAFGVVGIVVPLALALAMQRYVIRGMTFGAVKD